MHLLAIPYYGPNNQITSVLVQLFIAHLLNMTAVLPRRIAPHNVWSEEGLNFSTALRLQTFVRHGGMLSHSFSQQNLHVVGSKSFKNNAYVHRYTKMLDYFKVKNVYDLSNVTKTTTNGTQLVAQIRQLNKEGRNVVYTDYGASLFKQLHPGSLLKQKTVLETQLHTFIQHIAPVVGLPCNIGIHLRIFDTVSNATLSTPLSNLTYGLHWKHADTNKTLGNFFSALQNRGDFVKIMMPPAINNTVSQTVFDGHFMRRVESGSVVKDEQEIAACNLFVGDKISSISTAIMRMRTAANMSTSTSMSLDTFIKTQLA